MNRAPSRPLLLTAGLAAAAVFSLAAPRSAQACFCVPGLDRAKQFEMSEDVFLGTVRAVNQRQGDPLGVIGVLDVERVWKGALGTRKIVATGWTEADCGVPFHVGERFIVYAIRGRDIDVDGPIRLNSNPCLGTELWSEEHARDLGEGLDPALFGHRIHVPQLLRGEPR